MEANIIKLAVEMADVFDSLTITYLISSSVVISILGELRATLDVDMVNVQLPPITPLIAITNGKFSFDIMVKKAIEYRSSFDVIHFDSVQKVDTFLLSNHLLVQVEI